MPWTMQNQFFSSYSIIIRSVSAIFRARPRQRRVRLEEGERASLHKSCTGESMVGRQWSIRV